MDLVGVFDEHISDIDVQSALSLIEMVEVKGGVRVNGLDVPVAELVVPHV